MSALYQNAIEHLAYRFGGVGTRPKTEAFFASLNDLARQCLRLEGVKLGHHEQLFARALATSDFPKILADSANVALARTFATQPSLYQHFSELQPVNDFKPVHLVAAGLPGTMPEIPEGGEYSFLPMTDEGESASIQTHGGMITLNRATVVNDAVSAIKGKLRNAALIAHRTVTLQAFNALMNPGQLSDGGDFFHNDRNNLLAGGSSALDADSLGEAVKRLRTMTNSDGDFLDYAPKYLLVSPALETTAWALVNSHSLPGQDNSGVSNIFRERHGIEVLVAPQLSLGSLGGTDTLWFLIASPASAPSPLVCLSMTDTWPRAYVDSKMGWNRDGIEVKVRVDSNFKAIHPQSVVRSDGQ